MAPLRILFAVLIAVWFAWAVSYNTVILGKAWIALAPALTAAGLWAYGSGRLLPTLRSKTEAGVAVLSIWLVLSAAVLFVLPNTYGLLPLPTKELDLTIREKSDSGRLRNRIRFLEHDAPIAGIRVAADDWSRLAPRDTVRATVIDSWFGLIVKDISRHGSQTGTR